MRSRLLLFACASAFASTAIAQNKIAGSIDCDKSDPMNAIPVPDRQGFAFVIGQNKCTWPKPVVIKGVQAKDFTNTNFSEIRGNSVQTTALGVTVYENGDKVLTRSTGSVDVKNGTDTGKWTIIDGTGKHAGSKGGGTYVCKLKGPEPGAGYTCDIKGSYTAAGAK